MKKKKGFNPMHNSAIDSEELLLLGWTGLFDAPTGFAHSVQILRESI